MWVHGASGVIPLWGSKVPGPVFPWPSLQTKRLAGVLHQLCGQSVQTLFSFYDEVFFRPESFPRCHPLGLSWAAATGAATMTAAFGESERAWRPAPAHVATADYLPLLLPGLLWANGLERRGQSVRALSLQDTLGPTQGDRSEQTPKREAAESGCCQHAGEVMNSLTRGFGRPAPSGGYTGSWP